MIYGTSRNRSPSGRRLLMAGLAHVLRIDMGITLATGHRAVVTTDAIGGNAGVVYAGTHPRRDAMAGVAFLSGL